MNTEQVKQFDSIFNALSESLDITETQYEAAVRSYRAVGDWLAKADSVLVSYNPIIRAQGSFMLGTMIRPLNEQDDLDIDLVCELTGKGASWTQYDLKHKVGNRLKDHETYKRMLDEEGRRCWTLKYAQESNYHMDILPCLVAKDYKTVMERSFSASLGAIRELDNLAIRITDKESANYRYDPSPENWMKSNPFGYGIWFIQRATAGDRQKMMLLAESVRAVPKYQSNKTPLQRAVQILKRHRDIMFAGDEDKPVSIIITTLAAKAYQGEGSITEALQTILIHMDKYILNEFDNMFPDAKCELEHSNELELLIAVMLSAQTTDASVNRLTKTLFQKYKTVEDYANAPLQQLENDIKTIGLYRNKAKNVKAMAQMLIDDFNGEVHVIMKHYKHYLVLEEKPLMLLYLKGFKFQQ